MAALTNIRRSSWVYILLSLSVFSIVRVTAGPPPVETIKFQGPDIFPGGFDWDDKHDRFLLGSTTFGSLFSLSLDGTLNEFVKDSDYAGKFAILGISVDGIHNRVVAVIQDLNFSAPAFSGIAAYDLDSNKRLFFTQLDTVVLKEGKCSLPFYDFLKVNSLLNIFLPAIALFILQVILVRSNHEHMNVSLGSK